MASNAGSPPPAGPAKKKRTRAGVDESLIIDAPRKRRFGGVEIAGDSRRGRGNSPNPATVHATDPEGFQRVQQLGMQLFDKLVAKKDSTGRPLWHVFADLPSQEEYPDYYKMIKKPVSFNEIKAKLDNLQYSCLADVRGDINQAMVNAKRYNAPGSAIFLDAKKLHKVMKDTYAVMTGEAPAPEEDEPATGGAGETSGRRPSLFKSWLLRKLDETTSLTDPNGRYYADDFQVLPDRDYYPDYYQIITEPMAFEVVRSRIVKQSYRTVDQFERDINTIFANAMWYNQDTSRIWKDALVLKNHFAEVMKEAPPDFGTAPSRPSAGKRRSDAGEGAPGRARSRRQSSTAAMSVEPEEDLYVDDDGGSDDGLSRQGSIAPVPAVPFAGVQPKLEPDLAVDPYAIPGVVSSPALASGAVSSPALGGGAALGAGSDIPVGGPADLAANPLLGLASASASLMQPSFATFLNGASASTAPFASDAPGARPGIARRSVSGGASSEPAVFHPRLVARLPRVDERPLVSHFELRCSSARADGAKPLVVRLDNAHARQHAVALPPSVERVEVAPFFALDGAAEEDGANSNATVNGKGKGRAGTNGAAASGEKPSVAVRVRPASLVLEPVADLPPAVLPGIDVDVGVAADPPARGPRYALALRQGLNTLEFVVRPSEADVAVGEGQAAGSVEGEEVYRLFVTK
ncbi:hypothetical protein Rhopal_000331-T1 [Rhodotorula paludigena]|uniref:Bromo domain-containing protein n=1 Tax=Rhodotorula paludigena TaxID=86838 RepID=A0AAV5GE69_9BASI|nr:hypothetical protein Rhopal_000331-T1 [Rhodotorula paludigena]